MWQQPPQQYTWMEGLKSKHYINMSQEGWPSWERSHMQTQDPLFESWRVPCGRRVPSLHCASPVGSLGVLRWGLWCPDHSSYGLIQHSLTGSVPIKSRPRGLVTNGCPRPLFLFIKKKNYINMTHTLRVSFVI